MKTVLFALFTLILVQGCAKDAVDKKPSQFIPTEQKYEISGCEQLKREVELYNREHPDEKPLVVDC